MHRRRTSRVTLADVARDAGVSTTTVSLILSGRPDRLVQFHHDTIQKVRESAERLRYRAHLFASGLPTQGSSVFAVVTRDIGKFENATSWHLWAFEGDLLAGVMKVATARGLYPIIANAEEHGDAATYLPIERVIEGGVFGAIVRTPPTALEQYLHQRLKKGFPLVVMFPARLAEWKNNCITTDDAAVGRLAARILLQAGARQWAVVHYAGVRPRESHMIRRRAFEQVAEEAGIRVRLAYLPRESQSGVPADSRWLEKPEVDGVFALDSVLSVNTLRFLSEGGRKPGEDVQLVGVNCSRWYDFPRPRIASLDVSWKDAGATAMTRLAELASSGQVLFDRLLILPTFVPGDTCTCPSMPVSGPADAAVVMC